MAYTFNGTAKRITLSAGTTTVVLAEMYSRWKDWVLDDNAGFLPAFTTVGGDIPAIPLYLFLENGWRIVPQSADHSLNVTGGVLQVQGGGDPFVDPAGAYKIRINLEVPGIAIGYSADGVTGPSAGDIAQAVWQRGIEAGLSAEEFMRIFLAAMTGKTTGLGTQHEEYLGQNGEVRIAVDFDADSNRVDVALDGD